MIRNRPELTRTDRHRWLLDAVVAGIETAHPRRVIERTVRLEGTTLTVADGTDSDAYDLDAVDDLLVLGGGNAAGHVGTALEEVLGSHITGGVVVTDDPADTDVIETIEGTHPLPSEANVEGTQRLLELAATAEENDLVLAVITGGASALLCAPVEEVSLDSYRTVTDDLLRSGATIDEINAVRKHLSAVKGGQFARLLAPARTAGLVFSDVVGNRLDVIASGPTAPDPSTYADARAVTERYGLSLPRSVERRLHRGCAGDRTETPGADDSAFDRVRNYILADNRTALDAAAARCREVGYEAVVLSAQLTGEAREVGAVHAGIVRECLDSDEPFDPPVALLSGGETTVTVSGEGTGGPNQEFALGAALALDEEAVILTSIDTDGIDGPTDAAGALVDSETVPEGDRREAQAALENNDAYTYFDERNLLVETGPTGTNVNDLRVVFVGSPP